MWNERKKALIVVDVQNDFCPGGSLAVANGDEVVAPLNELMKEFLAQSQMETDFELEALNLRRYKDWNATLPWLQVSP